MKSSIIIFLLLLGGTQVFSQTNLVPDDVEFHALKDLYDSLGGSAWTTKTNWPTAGSWPSTATAAQMATWYGVTVSNGDIEKITLSNNHLVGKIPSSVTSLTQLDYLALHINSGITGSIPTGIGALTKLQTIAIYQCNLSGSIPSGLFTIPALRVVSLNNNKLTGSIPSNIGNATNVYLLSLSSNQLSGSIPPSIGNLIWLSTLQLNGNKLTGSIPHEIGNLASFRTYQLQVLDFSTNQLTGSIPSELGRFTGLLTLNLATNQLSGSIPAEIGNITNVTTLNFRSNKLTGSIPSSIGNLTKVTSLYLDVNQLTGALPSTFSNLTTLQYLYLSGNKLSGTLPAGFSNLNQLLYLYMDGNSFEGTFNISGFTKLLMMNLSGNNFSGAFPSGISASTTLSYLKADKNKFTSLPSGLLTLPVITTINFDNNNLTAVPDFSTHVNKTNLVLTLTNNQLDFFQLEPQVAAGIKTVTYSPQKSIDVSSVAYNTGTTLTIPARPTGQFSTITWQKQQPAGTWSTINTSNGDNTQQTFQQPSSTTASEGTYRWTMTNTKVTGFTLQSNPIVVKTAQRIALDNYGFQYKYDGRKRMIAKKVPGADWVYMVYDDRDRLVLTQDGNQRLNNQWMFTKYDALNRPVSTGIYSPGSFIDQATMQANVNSYYSNLTSAQAWYETFSTASGNVHNYDNKSFPQVTDANAYLTASYFDDNTTIGGLWGANYNYTNDNLASGTYAQPSADFRNVTGHPVAAKVKLLDGTNTWLKSITYYDDKYRVIQTIADNAKGGTDRMSSLYDFPGRVLTTKLTHKTSTHADQTVARTFEYDHASRLIKTWHSVNGAAPTLLTQNEYNEVGQLVDKKLHSADGNTFKQSVDYRYNIRGWLTSVNDSQLANNGNNDDANSARDLFGMNLSYNDAISGLSNAAQYNGNISAIKWSNNLAMGTVKDVAYSYSYDTLNRLKSSAYFTNPGAWVASNNFAEKNFAYDLNGNIRKLTRTDASGAAMDNLTYDYTGQGNQLKSVTDAGDLITGFGDGNVSGDDYVYDVNGNMTADKNKNISTITYNHLNLPQQVTKSTGEYIKYTYDAGGRKLKQQVYNASSVLQKTTDYDGEFIYQGDTLQFVNHEEGRIVMKGVATPEYQYHLKDHLGNVRMTFTSQQVTDQPVATFETANLTTEQSQFLRYDDARVVNSTLFDHTHNGTTAYSERLTGSANEKTGIARSISVMPGDTIKMEVYAKYVDASNSNNTAALTQLLAQIAAGTASAGTVIDGANYSTNGLVPFPFAGLSGTSSSSGTGPKAYLNYLIFDRNFVLVNGGYVRMTAVAKEDGTNVAHEKLAAQVVITQPGYVYTYLSNEETTAKEVYFDDFKVTQVKSPVVQQEDFYPFGLTFNSYQRESSVPQNYLYNGGTELRTDLGLNVYETMFRMYDPAIGRFWQIDELADFYSGINPYSYAFNNPISFNDPDGLAPDWWGKFRAFVNRVGNILSGKGGPGVWSDKNGQTWSTGSRGNGSKPAPKPGEFARKFDVPNDTRPDKDIKYPGLELANVPGVSGGPKPSHIDIPEMKPPVVAHNKPKTHPDPDPDPEFGGQPIREGSPVTFNAYQFRSNDSRIYHVPENDRLFNELVRFLTANRNVHLVISGNVNTNPANESSPVRTTRLGSNRAMTLYLALWRAGVSTFQLKWQMGTVGTGIGNQSTTFQLIKK